MSRSRRAADMDAGLALSDAIRGDRRRNRSPKRTRPKPLSYREMGFLVPPGGEARELVVEKTKVGSYTPNALSLPLAAFASTCPYCGRKIPAGSKIDKTYVPLGWGRDWARGRSGDFTVHPHCTELIRRRREKVPLLPRTEYDAAKARAWRGFTAEERAEQPRHAQELYLRAVKRVEAKAERAKARRRNARTHMGTGG